MARDASAPSGSRSGRRARPAVGCRVRTPPALGPVALVVSALAGCEGTSVPAKPTTTSVPAADEARATTAPLEPSGRDRAAASAEGPSDAAGSRARAGSTAKRSSPSDAATGVVRLLVGGDVSFGQLRGQEMLRAPDRDDFDKLQPLFGSADLRFVNLESQLSDQQGETVSPLNPLVFTGPPAGAKALARAGIEAVSLANNHAWDYGRDAFLETLSRLEQADVAWVGAGRDRSEAERPLVLHRNGVGIAFVAATGIWNQGPLASHPGREHVMEATAEQLERSVQRARATDGVDVVVVSVHVGDEYVDTPREGTRTLLRAAARAGADVVVGHHPHVVQRVEIVDGTPIFYSLGNLLMRMVTGQPWTQFGLLARIDVGPSMRTTASICPVRIHGLDAIALGSDPERATYERFFRTRYEQLLRAGEKVDPGSSVTLGPFAADGCASVQPRAGPAATEARADADHAPR